MEKRLFVEDGASERRAGKMETLQQVDAAVERDAQMDGLLDTFDQHLGAAILQIETSGRKKAFGCGMATDSANQAPSILDDVGASGLSVPRSKSGAEIVDGDADAVDAAFSWTRLTRT